MKTENLSCANCMSEILFEMKDLKEAQIRDLFSCQTWWRNTDATACAVVISNCAINVVTGVDFFNHSELYAHCRAIFIVKRYDEGFYCYITRIK